jgi:hypothetical protein
VNSLKIPRVFIKAAHSIGNGDAQCFRLFALGHTAPAPLVSTRILWCYAFRQEMIHCSSRIACSHNQSSMGFVGDTILIVGLLCQVSHLPLLYIDVVMLWPSSMIHLNPIIKDLLSLCLNLLCFSMLLTCFAKPDKSFVAIRNPASCICMENLIRSDSRQINSPKPGKSVIFTSFTSLSLIIDLRRLRTYYFLSHSMHVDTHVRMFDRWTTLDP